jgi:hypothetical protein
MSLNSETLGGGDMGVNVLCTHKEAYLSFDLSIGKSFLLESQIKIRCRPPSSERSSQVSYDSQTVIVFDAGSKPSSSRSIIILYYSDSLGNSITDAKLQLQPHVALMTITPPRLGSFLPSVPG